MEATREKSAEEGINGRVVIIDLQVVLLLSKEREREMFYLTTHSTHFIYGYMASDMVKDHSDSEKGNPLPPYKLLLSINSKGSFICTIPQTGYTSHGLCYTSRGALDGARNSSIGSLKRLQMRCTTEQS